MRYSLYQIQLTDDVVNRIRISVLKKQPRESVPEFDAKMQAMLGKPDLGIKLDLYEKVAEIEADDLDDVFDIGNVGPESKITRIKRMSSVSIGDLIVDSTGARFVVGYSGFELIK